jgi:hypothetical protein
VKVERASVYTSAALVWSFSTLLVDLKNEDDSPDIEIKVHARLAGVEKPPNCTSATVIGNTVCESGDDAELHADTYVPASMSAGSSTYSMINIRVRVQIKNRPTCTHVYTYKILIL